MHLIEQISPPKGNVQMVLLLCLTNLTLVHEWLNRSGIDINNIILIEMIDLISRPTLPISFHH